LFLLPLAPVRTLRITGHYQRKTMAEPETTPAGGAHYPEFDPQVQHFASPMSAPGMSGSRLARAWTLWTGWTLWTLWTLWTGGWGRGKGRGSGAEMPPQPLASVPQVRQRQPPAASCPRCPPSPQSPPSPLSPQGSQRPPQRPPQPPTLRGAAGAVGAPPIGATSGCALVLPTPPQGGSDGREEGA